MHASQLDTSIEIATPEGVELRLPVAGLCSRSLAWMIDAAIKFTTFAIVQPIVMMLGEFGLGVLFLNAFIILWFYNVFFEVFMNGATPGKRVLGIRVVNADGTPVGWGSSIIRNLIRVVDILPGAYLFGLLSVLVTKRMQRLGDLAADTVVVFRSQNVHQADFQGYIPLAVKVPLSPEEQSSIISFAERAPTLNPSRASELAGVVAPILGTDDVEELVRHAAWLVGHRRST